MARKKLFLVLAVSLLVFSFTYSVSAHGESDFRLDSPMFFVFVASMWLILLTVISVLMDHSLSKHSRNIFFFSIVIPVVLISLYLAGDTIYKNISSDSGGPVHWHADYQVWVCGNKIDLIDPARFSNKVGNPLLHEHNDGKIHVEGVIPSFEDITLSSNFEAINGKLSNELISYPTNDGYILKQNGDKCGDLTGTLKVYVNGKRVANFKDYILYPSFYVPPGDCIIVVFDDSDNETTNLTCESWQARGVDYSSFSRKEVEIGGRKWQ